MKKVVIFTAIALASVATFAKSKIEMAYKFTTVDKTMAGQIGIAKEGETTYKVVCTSKGRLTSVLVTATKNGKTATAEKFFSSSDNFTYYLTDAGIQVNYEEMGKAKTTIIPIDTEQIATLADATEK